MIKLPEFNLHKRLNPRSYMMEQQTLDIIQEYATKNNISKARALNEIIKLWKSLFSEDITRTIGKYAIAKDIKANQALAEIISQWKRSTGTV